MDGTNSGPLFTARNRANENATITTCDTELFWYGTKEFRTVQYRSIKLLYCSDWNEIRDSVRFCFQLSGIGNLLPTKIRDCCHEPKSCIQRNTAQRDATRRNAMQCVILQRDEFGSSQNDKKDIDENGKQQQQLSTTTTKCQRQLSKMKRFASLGHSPHRHVPKRARRQENTVRRWRHR